MFLFLGFWEPRVSGVFWPLSFCEFTAGSQHVSRFSSFGAGDRAGQHKCLPGKGEVVSSVLGTKKKWLELAREREGERRVLVRC